MPKRDAATGRLSGGNPGNSGGKKGRSGSKPLSFKLWCKNVLDEPETQAAVRRIMRKPASRHFAAMYRTLAGYSEGLPTQTISITGDAGIQEAFDIAKRQIRNRLPSTAATDLITRIELALRKEL